ncbi:hypothetical protein [Tenacibaculum sp. 190524A05c]|uniref:hypothetical protein n=1 Tax=Tenacibaculum platacis TaxID=3137852 RepID=UPI0032B18F31
MLEKILKLKGVEVLTKNAQKDLSGGVSFTHAGNGGSCPESNCKSDSDCRVGRSYCRSVGSGNCYWKECSPG